MSRGNLDESKLECIEKEHMKIRHASKTPDTAHGSSKGAILLGDITLGSVDQQSNVTTLKNYAKKLIQMHANTTSELETMHTTKLRNEILDRLKRIQEVGALSSIFSIMQSVGFAYDAYFKI